MRSDEPICIALIPRWSEAVFTVQHLIIAQPWRWFVIAIAETEQEAVAFRKGWTEAEPMPLLLLRTSPCHSMLDAADAVTEIAASHPGVAVSVLLCDGPQVSGFTERKRRAWNRQFAYHASEQVLDIQVMEYSSSWMRNPPRPR